MKILSHACSVVEFCPACRSVQTMQGVRYGREEKGAAGRKKTIVTMTFHCGSCGSFLQRGAGACQPHDKASLDIFRLKDIGGR